MFLKLASIVIIAAVVLTACGGSAQESSNGSPSDVVQAAVQAYVEGFNNRELTSFHAFFATTAQGADAAGLAQTLDAANQALNDSQAGDQFQLQNFQITSQRIDEQNNAAVVHYLASVAIVRNETDAVFAATVEQDVALILVDNQWLISGGDAPQITPTVSATLPGG